MYGGQGSGVRGAVDGEKKVKEIKEERGGWGGEWRVGGEGEGGRRGGGWGGEGRVGRRVEDGEERGGWGGEWKMGRRGEGGEESGGWGGEGRVGRRAEGREERGGGDRNHVFAEIFSLRVTPIDSIVTAAPEGKTLDKPYSMPDRQQTAKLTAT